MVYKKINCVYCDNKLEGKKHHFCSTICGSKYWAGVYSKKWKRGNGPVMKGNKPTQEELKREQKKQNARKLAYINYPKGGLVFCDICKQKTKDIQRHHEDYKDNSDICILVCRKCHGFIKRYNSLQKMLIQVKRRLKK